MPQSMARSRTTKRLSDMTDQPQCLSRTPLSTLARKRRPASGTTGEKRVRERAARKCDPAEPRGFFERTGFVFELDMPLAAA